MSYLLALYPSSWPCILPPPQVSFLLAMYPTSCPSILPPTQVSYLLVLYTASYPSILPPGSVSYLLPKYPTSWLCILSPGSVSFLLAPDPTSCQSILPPRGNNVGNLLPAQVSYLLVFLSCLVHGLILNFLQEFVSLKEEDLVPQTRGSSGPKHHCCAAG